MLTSFIKIGHAPTDSSRDRFVKSTFVIAMIGFTLFLLQLVLFEERTALELILDWVAIVGTLGSLVFLQLRKRVDLAYIFVASFGLTVLAGVLLIIGNRNGDFFLLLMIPLFSIAILGTKRSIPLFTATVLVALLGAIGDAMLPHLSSSLHRSPINPEGLVFHSPAREPFTEDKLVGFLTSLTVSYLVLYSAYTALQQANDRIESLLLNMLPSSIAARLTEETRRKFRQDGAGIADEHNEVTILFADIVGFTDIAAQMTPTKLMSILDTVFTDFDYLAEKHHVEKIKTIGDAYMAVCGLPEPDPDHAQHVADMALEMLDTVRCYREMSGITIRLRIGINSGPVVAGIIGRKKFIYDLWGDAVNIASRMESHGVPDTIQVGAGTQEALENTYDLESLGNVEIKGKGLLPAWRLLGRKAT